MSEGAETEPGYVIKSVSRWHSGVLVREFYNSAYEAFLFGEH